MKETKSKMYKKYFAIAILATTLALTGCTNSNEGWVVTVVGDQLAPKPGDPPTKEDAWIYLEVDNKKELNERRVLPYVYKVQKEYGSIHVSADGKNLRCYIMVNGYTKASDSGDQVVCDLEIKEDPR